MSYIKRALEVLNDRTSLELVVIITGARLIGKTEILLKIITENPKREYVSLEDLRERHLAKTNPEKFLETYSPPVCIDEAHYAPELFPFIRAFVEEHKNSIGMNYNGSYWLVGSQPIKLFDDDEPISTIPGRKLKRVAYLHMTPLSQSESTVATYEPFDMNPWGSTIKRRATLVRGEPHWIIRILS